MSDDRTYPTRPYVGVGAVVWREGKVLLIRRGKEPSIGQWTLPGGTQEIGETIEETAQREILEETGCVITDLELLCVADEIRCDDNGAVRHHYSIIDFDARWVSGEPSPGEDELDARFFALHELDQLDLWETARKAIMKSAKHRA